MDSNKNSKKLKKSDLSITIMLLIGILVVVNFFSYHIFTRLDLTQNEIYSISDVSKNAMANLDDVVNITVYFSDNLPHQVMSLKQEVVDMLDEYQNFSKGNVEVEFISPEENDETKRELYMKGIAPLSFQVYEKDKVQAITGYMAIEITYSDNSEIIPALKRDTSDFEYQITSAIKKVTNDNDIVIGFLSNYEAMTLENDLTAVGQVLDELYTVRSVELGDADLEIPADINTLVIPGPKAVFSEDHLKAVNSFLMRGGSVFALIDGTTISTEQGLLAEQNNTGLSEMLEKYGIKINKDLVADVKNGVISFRQGNFPFPVSVNYPLWPKITNDGFNQDFLAVSSLQNVVLPWASSIDVDDSKLNEANVVNLILSSDKSWVQTENFNLDPNASTAPTGEQKSRALAVSANGILADAYPAEGVDAEKIASKLIVVSDSEFMADGFLQSNPDNLKLFQNLVDSLSLDDDLISIRSKDISIRPINEGKELDDSTRIAIRYFNVFGITVIVVAFGMIRYFLRKRSSFADDL
jgi:gliding-associated putative ABC transporter substrate-binding component GldG